MTLEATEAECAAVAVAPRVSLSDIVAAMDGVYRFTGGSMLKLASAAGGYEGVVDGHVRATAHLSICMIIMKNGFVVIGKSAPASPENFDAELGHKLAYEDAVRQIWPLMGWALREKLAAKA